MLCTQSSEEFMFIEFEFWKRNYDNHSKLTLSKEMQDESKKARVITENHAECIS